MRASWSSVTSPFRRAELRRQGAHRHAVRLSDEAHGHPAADDSYPLYAPGPPAQQFHILDARAPSTPPRRPEHDQNQGCHDRRMLRA